MKEEVTDVAAGLDTHLKKMGGIAKVHIFMELVLLQTNQNEKKTG